MSPRTKKLIDWFAIIFGVLTIIANLILPAACPFNTINSILRIAASVLALSYMAYAVWLYFVRRADFDWHLINGHFLRKVCAIVVLMPSFLTLLGFIFVNSPDELFYEGPIYDPDAVTIFWSTYFHFIDPGNPHMTLTPAARLWAVIVGMTGILLLTGLLVSSIVGWFDNRKSKWNDGSIRYKLRFLGKNKFAVVIGANEIAASVIRNLFATKQKNEVNYKAEGRNRYVILQTSRKAEDVRAELMSHLTLDELKKVIIYNALRDSDEEVEFLYVEHATEIYVLGESTLMDGGETYHDALNMSCVNLIAAQLEKTRLARIAKREKLQSLGGKRIPVKKVCKVMFDYQTTSSIFQFSDISQLIKDNLVFIPFNRYESWARKVIVDGTDGTFDYMPLEGTGLSETSDDFVHLVVVGMSKMGVAMGVEALLQAHYLNSEKARTRITFIDTNADKEMAFFKGRYANMFELIRTRYIDATAPAACGASIYSGIWEDPIDDSNKWEHLTEDKKNFLDVEIEFIKGSIESDNVRECLESITSDKYARVTIAICLTYTHQAIAASLYMPINVYKSKRLQQVWVYQRESDAILAALINDANDLRYSKIRPFGMLYGEYMSDRSLYLKGLLVNYAYDVVNSKNADWPQSITDKDDPNFKAARKSWGKLPVSSIWSNKYFADSIYIKIRNILFDYESCVKETCNMTKAPRICDNSLYRSQALVKELLKVRFDKTLEIISDAIRKHEPSLAVCEHNRWNIQQLLLGYSPCEKDLDDIFRLLNLPDDDPKKDMNHIKKLYADWRKKNLGSECFSKSIKNDVKECSLRIHPNICCFKHLDIVDSKAKPYDSMLNAAIPKIIELVDGYGLKPKIDE